MYAKCHVSYSVKMSKIITHPFQLTNNYLRKKHKTEKKTSIFVAKYNFCKTIMIVNQRGKSSIPHNPKSTFQLALDPHLSITSQLCPGTGGPRHHFIKCIPASKHPFLADALAVLCQRPACKPQKRWFKHWCSLEDGLPLWAEEPQQKEAGGRLPGDQPLGAATRKRGCRASSF